MYLLYKGQTVLLKEHASGSDSEPRKQRGSRSPNKRKPDTSVKLDADVKEQLVTGDRQIPSFTSENVGAETTTFQEKKEKANVGTLTHPKDFSNVQRILNEKLKLTAEDGFFKMVDTRPRIISNGASPVERSNIQVKFDFFMTVLPWEGYSLQMLIKSLQVCCAVYINS